MLHKTRIKCCVRAYTTYEDIELLQTHPYVAQKTDMLFNNYTYVEPKTDMLIDVAIFTS